ncbi:hypothetical protein [Streptomyces sp. DSM 40750]|uniref:hypothetical protein n=1 Tax=Streptomyces sp. DSM 40750 TaxID=2801030 RepID=UPI00214CB26F|nr:hypothetical protein [Streptomyces sp. DSM 40750]UUU24521.1 hypothetical protein JIX55_32075 [Streptomyces sp. DSM 40750]
MGFRSAGYATTTRVPLKSAFLPYVHTVGHLALGEAELPAHLGEPVRTCLGDPAPGTRRDLVQVLGVADLFLDLVP